MSELTYKVIVNPAAGRGASARAAAQVNRTFREAGVRYDLVETRQPGDALAFAQEAIRDGCDVVVAVGGDGTAHEVVNGLVQRAQKCDGWDNGAAVGTLGIVPLGTGNDFASRLGIPENNPEAACRIILENQRLTTDLGQVRDEHGRTEIFHNHLGGGIEAAINIESRKIQRLRGLFLYLTAVLRVIPRYTKPPRLTLHYNDTVQTRPLLLASAANGGRSGGGFKIAPLAQLDDGELDLVLANSPHIVITLWLLPQFLLGTHGAQKRFVAMHRIRSLVMEAPDGVPIHLDGEIFRTDARRIELAVLPQRLWVLARAKGRR